MAVSSVTVRRPEWTSVSVLTCAMSLVFSKVVENSAKGKYWSVWKMLLKATNHLIAIACFEEMAYYINFRPSVEYFTMILTFSFRDCCPNRASFDINVFDILRLI